MTDLARNSIAVIISLAIVVVAIAGVKYFFFKQPLLPMPPAPAVSSVPSPSPMPSPPPQLTTPSPQPPESPTSETEAEIAQMVVLEADDFGFYPSNIVTAKAGSMLTLMFKVRTTNVYYGGLEIESPLFNTGPVKPGGIVSVDFAVPKGKTVFTSYWPYQKTKKAEGEIMGQ